jgi:hypothetical protein
MCSLTRQATKKYVVAKLSIIFILLIIFCFEAPIPVNADNSTTLSFNPETVDVYMLSDGVNGQNIFYVDLYINNVTNLKGFNVTVIWDGDILDFYSVHPSNWSGGGTWNPSTGYGSQIISNANLREALTGTGVLLRYQFIAKKLGSTSLQLRNVVLTDIYGSPISVSGSSTSIINIKSGTDLLNVEYAKLQDKYSLLQTNYDHSKKDLEMLTTNFNSTKADLSNLQTQYNSLKNENDGLHSLYDGLKSENNGLQTQNSNLQSNLSLLQTKYTELNNEYATLQTQQKMAMEMIAARNSEIALVRYILYSLASVILILIILTVYLLLRMRKKTSKIP